MQVQSGGDYWERFHRLQNRFERWDGMDVAAFEALESCNGGRKAHHGIGIPVLKAGIEGGRGKDVSSAIGINTLNSGSRLMETEFLREKPGSIFSVGDSHLGWPETEYFFSGFFDIEDSECSFRQGSWTIYPCCELEEGIQFRLWGAEIDEYFVSGGMGHLSGFSGGGLRPAVQVNN